MYFSVHETCAERFLLHYSIAFSSPCILFSKKTQNTLDITFFSVISVLVCRTRPTNSRISVSELYPKIRIRDKKGRFLETLVQLVQYVHLFTACAIGRHVKLLGIQPGGEKYGEKHGFGVI